MQEPGAAASDPARPPLGGPPTDVERIFQAVTAAAAGRPVTMAGVVNLAADVLVEVERVAGLSGPQKKELALAVLARLVDAVPGPPADRDAIRFAAEAFLPAMIDSLVAAAKGQYVINAAARPTEKKPEPPNPLQAAGGLAAAVATKLPPPTGCCTIL